MPLLRTRTTKMDVRAKGAKMNWVTEKSLLPPEEAFRSYPDFNEAVHAYEVDSDLYAGARPVTSNDLLQGQIIDL